MSGHSLIMFVSVVAIAIAANRAEEAKTTAPSRAPASVNGKKEIVLLQKDLMKHTHKARGPLAAAVELLGQRPEQPGDVFVLKGLVSAESDLHNVTFSWGLPAGVEVVNGPTASTIAFVGEGKPFETQITLRQVSPTDARVTFRVKGEEDAMRFGDTAVYNTFDQEKLRAARLELKASTEEYMSSQKKLELRSTDDKKLKIMH